MNTTEALEFLSKYQPLPDDEHLTEHLISIYDAVREHFIVHHKARCVPLFLNSFGNGMGFGVYQVVEDVIATYSENEVVPHLAVALSNTRGGIRWWACQISERFPSPDLIEPLAEVLSVGNEDERFAAVTSLGAIEDPKVSQTLRSALNNETLQDIKEHILSTIEFNRKKQLRD